MIKLLANKEYPEGGKSALANFPFEVRNKTQMFTLTLLFSSVEWS